MAIVQESLQQRVETRFQKLQRAVHDPEYRLNLLLNGDPDLSEIIETALWHVELAFRAALAGAGASMFARPLHPKKANHQGCKLL